MEAPAPEPQKLLQSWMEWERGEVTPGRVMANLKTGGLPILLEALVAESTGGPGYTYSAPADALPAPAVPAAAGGTGIGAEGTSTPAVDEGQASVPL